MIQSGSFLNVADNSNAKQVYCIKIKKGYKKRYAKIGDRIIISVKKLKKKKLINKTTKGQILDGVIVRTKSQIFNVCGFRYFFFENAVVLFAKKNNKYLATKIFGILPKQLRFTKYLKLLTIAAGISV